MTAAVTLAALEQGAPGAPAVVILHGLFGSARNWGAVAKRLAASHRVLALDLRNHGASPWAPTMSYAEMAADVRAALAARGLARAALVGHSLGGKTAMSLALSEPEAVERLAVVDVAPAASPGSLLPYVRAMRALDLDAVRRRAEAEAALAPAVPDAAVRAFLMQNLVAEEGGRFRWRLNLPAIERALPDLAGFPESGPNRAYAGPTLFIRGGRSDYVRDEHRAAILRLFPKARIATVPEAGHWVHAERPDAVLDLLRPFLGG